MSQRFPSRPQTGTEMLPSRPSPSARAMIALRRSAGKTMLGAPGPTGEALTELLDIAARVPDHRRLEPWRFIVFAGDARRRFGQKIADIYKIENPDADDKELSIEAGRFLRAPCIIAIISSPDRAHKTPVWEQELSAGAVCQNLLLAANATGWAGVWLTEWIAYHREIHLALSLSEEERIAGFIYLGTAKCNPPERPRPDISSRITMYPGSD